MQALSRFPLGVREPSRHALANLKTGKPLLHRLAAIVHAGGPRRRTICKGHEQVGQPSPRHVLDQPRYGVPSAPRARLANDCQPRSSSAALDIQR